MGRILAYTLIVIGAIFLLNGSVLKLALPSFTRMGMPMGLQRMPFNQEFHVWIEVPLSMAVVARLISSSHIPPADGSLGGGQIQLELSFSKWEDDEDSPVPLRLMPMIFIQETSEIDQIQHYKAVLGSYGWSLWKLFSFLLFLLGIFGMVAGIVWKLRVKNDVKSSKD